MKEKIKTSRWLKWLVAFFAAIFILAIGNLIYFEWVYATPWFNALRVSIFTYINEFGEGVADMGSYWPYRISALAGLLILFVLAPALLVFGSDNKKDKPGVMWFCGSTLLFLGLIVTISNLGKQTYYYYLSDINNKNYKIYEQNRAKDKVRSQITTLALEAEELMTLPHKFGGGGGSFASIPDNGNGFRNIRLEDLKSYGTFNETSFVLELIESDSTIIIRGIGNLEENSSEFENSNGQTGKVELAFRVAPYNKTGSIEKLNNVSN